QNTAKVREKADRYHSFLEEYCLPQFRCKTQDLYDAYCLWCRTESNRNERYIPERDTFVEAIRKRGYVKKSHGKFQCFYGLTLKPSIYAAMGRPWYGAMSEETTAKRLEAEGGK